MCMHFCVYVCTYMHIYTYMYDIYTQILLYLQNTLHGSWIMIMTMASIQPLYISC